MMHLTEFSDCVTALLDDEVSCKSACVDGVMMGNWKHSRKAHIYLIATSSVCVVLVLIYKLHNVFRN